MSGANGRSHAYREAVTALQDAGIPCSQHDAPEVILLALQEAIIAAPTADPWAFDRAHYDRLMACWEALAVEQIRS